MRLRSRRSLAAEIPWPHPRRGRRRLAALVALALAASAAALAIGSAGASVRSAGGSAELWATVNICGPAHQRRLGVRGQMPGDGTSQQMWMRFSVQYRSKGHWHTIHGGVSRWQYAGVASLRTGQVGWTFGLTLPKPMVYLLRGVVQFQWRSGNHVVKHAQTVTTKGHPGTKGSRPRGYSGAFCRLRGKHK